MGAWDIGVFDNDDASDWLYELEDSSDTEVLAVALNNISLVDDDYLEAPECSIALAASEVVAALKGRPFVSLPEIVQSWVEEHRELDVNALVPVSQAAVDRIRRNSELQELWAESGQADEWRSALDDLSARLGIVL